MNCCKDHEEEIARLRRELEQANSIIQGLHQRIMEVRLSQDFLQEIVDEKVLGKPEEKEQKLVRRAA